MVQRVCESLELRDLPVDDVAPTAFREPTTGMFAPSLPRRGWPHPVSILRVEDEHLIAFVAICCSTVALSCTLGSMLTDD